MRRKRRRQMGAHGGLAWIGNDRHLCRSVAIDREHRIIIHLPETLDFDKNYDETADHFELLRKAIRARKRIRSLKFDRLRYISPSAALVLASEVDRWNQRVGGALRADVDSWDPEIKRVLKQMGYFSLLHLPDPGSIASNSSITFLPFKTAKVDAGTGGELAKQMREDIEAIVGTKIKRHFLFEGLSEAITNVGQHAYTNPGPFTLSQWWLSASYDVATQELCVTFFDQGDGIPATLPKAKFFELIKDLFLSWRDSEKIQAAMETGRSATGQTERGKGLLNLLEFARAHQRGRLSIFSLRGMFRQEFITESGMMRTTEQRCDFRTSIGGTLIEWAVKL